MKQEATSYCCSFRVYENHVLLARKAAQEESSNRTVREYCDMVAKERASGVRIVFYRRLVLTRAADNWRAAHPQK